MKYKISALALLLLSQQSFGIAVETNPHLKKADVSLIQSWDKQDMKRKMTIRSSSNEIEAQIKATGKSINDERTAIDAFKLKKDLEHRIGFLSKRLEQPATMCSALMNTQSSAAFNSFSADTSVFQSQGVVNQALNESNTSVKKAKAYRNNMKQFCSMDDQIKGLCQTVSEPQLQNGDVNASVLFGSNDSATRNQEQEPALSPVIENLTGVLNTPEKMTGGHYAGMQYEHLRRRYATIMGLAAEGLHDAASSHEYNPMEIVSLQNQISSGEMPRLRGDGDLFETSNGYDSEDLTRPAKIYETTSRQPFVREYRVSSEFNMNRLHPVLKTIRPHKGTDFAAPMGTETIALAEGRVVKVGFQDKGAGNYLNIYHPSENVLTKYFHLSKRLVKVGDVVKAGQVVALTGNTGIGTAAHLHFEIHKNTGEHGSNPVNWRLANFPSKMTSEAPKVN